MRTARLFLLVTPLVFLLIFTLFGCHSPAPNKAAPIRTATKPAPGEGVQKIQHIVFLIKENRSFDQYFGTFPGADGATSGKISTGQTVPLTHTPDLAPFVLC